MNTRARNLLITGGGGLIGTAARSAFEAAGWSVSTLDLCSRDLDGRPVDHICDITADAGLEARLNGATGIVHLAAVSRVCEAERQPERCTRVNLHGTMRLLKSAASAGCRWIIFGSSREVYGEQSMLPVCESAPLQPINHYGRIKLKGERMVAEQCRGHGMLHSVVRFSNVYGHPGDHPARVVNAFIRRALVGDALEIHGGGQVFDFTYLEDTAEAVVVAAEHLHSVNDSLPPMHILPGEPVGIEQLARLVLETTDSDSTVIFTGRRDYDVNRFHGNPHLMQSKLGFGCKTDLSNGLRLTVQAYREAMNKQGGMKSKEASNVRA